MQGAGSDLPIGKLFAALALPDHLTKIAEDSRLFTVHERCTIAEHFPLKTVLTASFYHQRSPTSWSTVTT